MAAAAVAVVANSKDDDTPAAVAGSSRTNPTSSWHPHCSSPSRTLTLLRTPPPAVALTSAPWWGRMVRPWWWASPLPQAEVTRRVELLEGVVLDGGISFSNSADNRCGILTPATVGRRKGKGGTRWHRGTDDWRWILTPAAAGRRKGKEGRRWHRGWSRGMESCLAAASTSLPVPTTDAGSWRPRQPREEKRREEGRKKRQWRRTWQRWHRFNFVKFQCHGYV